MNEITLIERCREGEPEAFEALFKQYSTKAVRTAYLMTGRKEIAEEVTQETFIKCFREIKNLCHPEAFSAWFYRLLVRLCWRYLSREKHNVSLESVEDNAEKLIAHDSDTLEILERNLINNTVQKAVNQLGEPLRTTVILYYFNELTVNEISIILGCRVGTIKSRLHNARKRLAKKLQAEYAESSPNGGQSSKENPARADARQTQGKEYEAHAKASTA